MALTVEDGTIVSGADSYVTLAEYQEYGAARGWTLGDADADDEKNLRRGFDAINRKWEYIGEKVDPIYQQPAFPRYIIKDRFEYVVPANEIPWQVKDAQCELAYLIQGGLDLFETFSGAVKREKIDVIEVEYAGGGQGMSRAIAVEGLLRPFLSAGPGQSAMQRR